MRFDLLIAAIASLALAAPLFAQRPIDVGPPNAPKQKPAFEGQTRAPEQRLDVRFEVTTVASGLDVPWGLAFLPDGRMLVTEREGRLRVVSADGAGKPATVTGLPPVDARGQGGLLDVAIHPRFATNKLIYWSYSEPGEDGNHTAVARGRFVDGPSPRIESVEVIFRQVPTFDSKLHFGSRLVFNRDGTLFVTLGDRSSTEGRMQSQRLDSLLGKIVRINDDGTIPKDNPFVGKPGARPEIWSYGHRNVQAAALHPQTGELWEVEHGARGGDELNLVRKGLDYGWPTITYGVEYSGRPITGGITQQQGMEQPRYYWDPVIAPSGMTFYSGDLFPAWRNSVFIGGLAGTSLVRLTLEGEKVVGEERLLQERIRDVRQGPDGALYVLTNGWPGRLLKLQPQRAGQSTMR
jgi:glucose/arabinose dehydrogenase